MITKGKLYVIPNTIGENDVSKTIPLYVKEVIHQLDEFIVENSKVARAFLKVMQIPTSQNELTIHLLNKQTAPADLDYFLHNCKNGKSIGLISDAGCPGIADPGAEIVEIAHQLEIKVVPLVGPSSILLSLMASGMNGQNFTFNGYLPIDKVEVKNKLKELERISKKKKQTQIFIETPYRNMKLLEIMFQTLQKSTKLCIACDITMKTEFIKTSTIINWRKAKIPQLQKRPCIFLIQTE